MKYTNKTVMALVAAVSVALLSACASGPTPTYRTYFVDRNCNYFYVDNMGNRVVDGHYTTNRLVGLPLRQDAMGRWFYEDAYGNRIYQSRYCH